METFNITYERYIDGKFQKIICETVEADTIYQAIWHLGQQNGSAYPEKNIEDIITEVIVL